MTTSRLLYLQIALLFVFGTVFLIPKSPPIRPSAVGLQLPETIGQWEGRDAEVSEKELAMLAKDTQFARKLYSDPFGNEIFVSIVLSGNDLDNSIHRPERCLPAQGWTINSSRIVKIPVPAAPGGELETMRLYNVRPVRLENGVTTAVHNLNYYWFVGYKDFTASHLRRTYIDLRDRIFRGYNQRWAYITVASTITSGLTAYGRSEEQTDEMIRDFIQHLFPEICHPAS